MISTWLLQDLECCEYFSGVESVVHGFRQGPSKLFARENIHAVVLHIYFPKTKKNSSHYVFWRLSQCSCVSCHHITTCFFCYLINGLLSWMTIFELSTRIKQHLLYISTKARIRPWQGSHFEWHHFDIWFHCQLGDGVEGQISGTCLACNSMQQLYNYVDIPAPAIFLEPIWMHHMAVCCLGQLYFFEELHTHNNCTGTQCCVFRWEPTTIYTTHLAIFELLDASSYLYDASNFVVRTLFDSNYAPKQY